MLLTERVDYVIEYSFIANYLAKTFGYSDQVTSLVIEESNPYTLAVMACPKNKWGIQMINKINHPVR